MKLENLATANELAGRIHKAEKMLAQLAPEKVSVVITPNKSNDKIMTVGCSADCEHDMAPYAVEFLQLVTAHYAAKLETLKAEFAAL